MVVDDDGVCLAMLSRGLRKRGYEVAAFGDPLEALDNLQGAPLAAVVTDIRMPRMSGLEVVREVRARLGDSAPPILVVSSEGDEFTLAEAFRLGAADYLIKPVSAVELGVKLERALRALGQNGAAAKLSFPRVMGPWHLEECVGRGGTACVFRAVRGDDPTPRALKVVWPHLVQRAEVMLRFRREIDTLAQLSHPGLVGFVESGRAGEALFFYVMDFVGGQTLRDRIRERGPGTAGEALDLIERTAPALSYLHDNDLVHRDVKPSNLFLLDDRVVLGDFGLVRTLLDRGVTLEDEFIGTPLYLAPEVFRSSDFDHTVDLYALGVCALELLLGAPPVDEPDPMRLIGRLLDRGLPSPEETLSGAVPPCVRRLVGRMIAPVRAERFPDAESVLAAVASARDEL